jgi:hypothetical protein
MTVPTIFSNQPESNKVELKEEIDEKPHQVIQHGKSITDLYGFDFHSSEGATGGSAKYSGSFTVT